jgi:glutamate carboxypeptidase
MSPAEVLKYFENRTDEIVDKIRDLVDIESPSFDQEQSAKVADWLEKQARVLGLGIERHTTDGVGQHVVIRAFQSGAEPVVLLGHTDTVHPIGTHAKNPTRIEEGKLYGCGVFDMKSGVVLMLEALQFFVANNITPSRPINILLSCDEEVGSATGREHVEHEAANAAACLILEPSANGKVKTGRKGTGMFQLTAHGVPAHAGLEPEKGANAVAELARQVDRIHAIARPYIGTTVNVTTFKGGAATNVIPDIASCDIDVRYSVAAEAERLTHELAELMPSDPRVRLELAGEINRPPLERNEQIIALYEKARDLAASFDYDLGETQVGGGSDGNLVAALGVPVLDGLGPAGDGAHTLHEYVRVDDLAKRAALVTLLLLNL